jgi:hypothetical protein
VFYCIFAALLAVDRWHKFFNKKLGEVSLVQASRKVAEMLKNTKVSNYFFCNEKKTILILTP